jgi:hypothetical protein
MCYSEKRCVSDKEIEQLSQIQQLTELLLGSSTEETDGGTNIFTVGGFKTTLKALQNMPKLTAVNIQLSHVKELDISRMDTYLLFNLGMGEISVQFIAQNIKNFTSLNISKQ